MESANSPTTRPLSLPIVSIEALAAELGLTRRWILEHWCSQEAQQPRAPHFRDGNHVFFEVESLRAWGQQRAAQQLDRYPCRAADNGD
ncbi:hypothetical protein Pla123a_28770 [Posidoniimonas polymericola]|uniref:Uncharacterized protein n=1 Tax=Posidoniimonas polymericola TaxID=2528002 RepID=A0A5C5YMS6_9BACT|nr:hypothetical protein [Posidoniimonas polymericola]TWT76088.1 hypothetical protein Pla123a_28770 [Posidoniimonas polymericola]